MLSLVCRLQSGAACRSAFYLCRALSNPAPRYICNANEKLNPLISRRFCGTETSSSFNVQDYEDFANRVLNAEKPIVVQFHADWCGPCRMLSPRLESIVQGKGGKVLLAKVNVDSCADLALEYGVQAIPAVIGFRDGSIVERLTGSMEDETIRNFVEKLDVDS